MAMIEVNHLTRDFEYYEKESGLKGSVKNLFRREKKVKHAVKDISFCVEEGEMVGFIGPNGAGKTTTLKMLSGILVPSSGAATVGGYTPWERKDAFKHSFSLVAGQKSQLWTDLPAIESFYLNKCIYKIPDSEYRKTVDELSGMLGVADYLKVQVRRLSLGERMKMELIAALLHKPRIFFLDEPTIGLDIISQNTIREYLKAYNAQTGSTVILTSHYTKDIEDICSRTIIINNGEKVFDGSMVELQRQLGNSKTLKVTFPHKVDGEELKSFGTILEHSENTAVFETSSEQIDALMRNILTRYKIEDMTVSDIPIERCIEAIYNGKQGKNP